MKWQPIELCCTKPSGKTDKLGNSCRESDSERKTFARVSVWNEKDKNIIGREITVNDRKFVVRIPFGAFPSDIESIKAAGICYDIFCITDLGKFTLVYAENQKGE